jgi:hypothetical protein
MVGGVMVCALTGQWQARPALPGAALERGTGWMKRQIDQWIDNSQAGQGTSRRRADETEILPANRPFGRIKT